MKAGKSLVELAQEIVRQNETKQDYIADTRKLSMFQNGEDFSLGIDDMNPFALTEIAHDQIGERLKIPAAFYDRCREKYPDLLTHNVNSLFQREPTRQMIRTLDGNARAFLSERYRPIDHHEIAEAVLPIISNWMQEGATVESAELTEKKLYIKVVNPRVQAEIVTGDIVQSGIVISNSEVGHGAVSVMPLVYRLVCSNGMICADAGQRKNHVGRVNASDENFTIYRDETRIADDRAFIMKLQDIVHAAANEVHFERIVSIMRDSREAHITNNDVPAVVQTVTKSYGLTESEGKGVLDHLIRGEELSLYGLANSVTRHAQESKSYDRSTEMEMIGFNILSMKRSTWNRFNEIKPAE